ncbi:MAG TPA: HAD family hydrolase [Candidatus Hydrogenedentes bacterium]|jgi:putative hydrolase of the HAD superfamily|nr:MAG: Pyrimidine 5'-nucleotidase YjjG [Candidatus Hydrogenedentes bacterium ADurb.Bin101]HQN01575.1 HAD family hydrolase [Candidatus Hydrogenedentota bacterium]
MAHRRIGVVTFDLWDCVFCDETDEPKRAAAGMPSKPVARRQVLHEALSQHGPIDRAAVDIAFNTADQAFRKVWHEQYVTWTTPERIKVVLAGLNRNLPSPDLAAVSDAIERMELECSPDLAPGVREGLEAIHGKYKLAVVSDAIFTPGKYLRALLEKYHLYSYFDFFVFSDEIGHSKPHPSLFESVAEHFGVECADIVHIGDRPHNDIGGPHAVGARGVLLTVVKNRPLDGHAPDAVCDNYLKLDEVLASLER